MIQKMLYHTSGVRVNIRQKEISKGGIRYRQIRDTGLHIRIYSTYILVIFFPP